MATVKWVDWAIAGDMIVENGMWIVFSDRRHCGRWKCMTGDIIDCGKMGSLYRFGNGLNDGKIGLTERLN